MRRPWLSPTLGACVALVLFVWTRAPELTLRNDALLGQSVLTDDSADGHGRPPSHAAATPTPAGALAGAWHAVDFGNLNTLSSVLMALATGTVILLARHAGGGGAAVLCALGFALSGHVWSAAVATEADIRASLHALFIGGAVACLVRAHPSRRTVWVASMAIVLAAIDDASMGLFFLLLLVGPQRVGLHGSQARLAGLVGLGTVLTAHLAVATISGLNEHAAPAGSLSSAVAAAGLRATALAREVARDLGPLPTLLGLMGLVGSPATLRVAWVVAWLVAIVGPVPAEFAPAARLPVLLALWWAAAAAALGMLARWPVPQARTVSVVVAVLMAVVQAIRLQVLAPTLVDSDTGKALSGLVQHLPDRGVVATERVRVMRALHWGLLRAGARGRQVVAADVGSIANALRDGRTVILLEDAWRRLSLMGVEALSEPVPGRSISEALRAFPDDAVVAGAASAGPSAAAAAPAIGGYLAGAGLPHASVTEGVAFVVQPRHRRGIVSTSAEGAVAADPDQPGGLLGSQLPPAGIGAIRDDAGGVGAVLNGQEVAYSDAGVVLASWDAASGDWTGQAFPLSGRLLAAWRLPGMGFFHVTRRSPCLEVRDSAASILELARTSRIGMVMPGGATATVELSVASPVAFRVAGFENRLAPAWEATNPPAGPPGASGGQSTVVVHNPDKRPSLVALSWSGLPTAASARANAPTQICAGSGGARVLTRAEAVRETTLNLNDTEAFGPGWSAPSREGGRRMRQMQADEAHLTLYSEAPGPVEVLVNLQPGPASTAAPPFTLDIDGVILHAVPNDEQPSLVRWHVPPQLWPVGFRRLILRAVQSSGGPASPRLVTSVRVRRPLPTESR